MEVLETTNHASSPLLPRPEFFADTRPDHLVKAVALLPAKERCLLSLLYVEGLTLIETALVLDSTVTAVWHQHSDACLLLREALSR